MKVNVYVADETLNSLLIFTHHMSFESHSIQGISNFKNYIQKYTYIIEPAHEKTNNLSFRSCLTQIDLCSHRKKVQVGKDQEKAQSEKDSHSKNQGGKKPN